MITFHFLNNLPMSPLELIIALFFGLLQLTYPITHSFQTAQKNHITSLNAISSNEQTVRSPLSATFPQRPHLWLPVSQSCPLPCCWVGLLSPLCLHSLSLSPILSFPWFILPSGIAASPSSFRQCLKVSFFYLPIG